jgi:hypothetical protein
MSIALELPPNLASQLAVEARERGLSVTDYVLHLLARETPRAPTCKTGAELVAYWHSEGLIGTRTDITDSSEHARRLRQQAEARTREGTRMPGRF